MNVTVELPVVPVVAPLVIVSLGAAPLPDETRRRLRRLAARMDVRVRDIRVMKARVEAERLPRGGDRRTHLKLGNGGLTDVEWTVQLVQLEHGDADPDLRVTGTMAGLTAAEQGGYLPVSDAEHLRAGWTLAASLRNASVLWRGRPVDAVPADLRDADGIGRIVGRPPGTGATLEEDYLRVARRSRAATNLNFYAIR